MPDENAANGKIGCSGEMCEYGMFRIRYLDQIEFECAEGKKIIYRMDRKRRILDGMEIWR